MSAMKISLPDALKLFVDEQVTQRGYGTSSSVREIAAFSYAAFVAGAQCGHDTSYT
jgi:hypothetical protein